MHPCFRRQPLHSFAAKLALQIATVIPAFCPGTPQNQPQDKPVPQSAAIHRMCNDSRGRKPRSMSRYESAPLMRATDRRRAPVNTTLNGRCHNTRRSRALLRNRKPLIDRKDQYREQTPCPPLCQRCGQRPQPIRPACQPPVQRITSRRQSRRALQFRCPSSSLSMTNPYGPGCPAPIPMNFAPILAPESNLFQCSVTLRTGPFVLPLLRGSLHRQRRGQDFSKIVFSAHIRAWKAPALYEQLRCPLSGRP